TEKRITAIEAAVQQAARDHPQLRVEQFGAASASKALSEAFEDDFQQAEVTSLPLTLIILVFAFGALVAAGIPLLLGFSSVLIAVGLISLPSQLLAVDEAVSSVILLIGMAVGVDYTLFYLRREREERRRGRSNEDALAVAAATSGRAVLVSGMTVIIAMAGMYLSGDKTFTGFATGTILVVLAAMVGSVTVLPAMLSWLGDRVDKGRIPFLAKWRDRREARGHHGAWSWIIDRVMAHPKVAAAGATLVLVALAIPALGLHTAVTGSEGLPRDLPVIQTYDRIQQAFPGGTIPAQVVVRADDVTSPEVRAGIERLERTALASGRFKEPASLIVSRDHRVAVVDLPIVGRGTDDRSVAALEKLRADIIPASIDQVGGTESLVTGQTAGSKDFNDVMKGSAPLVFAFVLTLAFLLLLVTFRSIVIPIKAIVLNLLSVGAAYGVLVLVFQNSWAEGLLGFESSGAITSWLPMFLFVILFGLSMDYHVFILSRIKEGVDRGMATDAAVGHGIKATAGVVTSAAAVMIGVFGVFATLGMLDFKQMGVGLAVAVLIDATIVRAVLLPASMKLLGRWNWYLPRSLQWLPRLRHDTPEPEGARA
ncbi:MAG TPA: MMPL family transporter, partial [Solirubrobacteraceae bacterium]|nr:MMPL family transporter [Solirubrobacteraceae bacterium]